GRVHFPAAGGRARARPPLLRPSADAIRVDGPRGDPRGGVARERSTVATLANRRDLTRGVASHDAARNSGPRAVELRRPFAQELDRAREPDRVQGRAEHAAVRADEEARAFGDAVAPRDAVRARERERRILHVRELARADLREEAARVRGP